MLYKILALILISPILLAPVSAYAIECESESPLKVTLGDQYYDLINDPKLSASTNKALIKRVKNLLGNTRFRSGHATRIVCKKVDGVLTAVTHEYELKEVDGHYTNRGDINIKLLIDDHERRTVKTHTLSFPSDIGWQPGNAANELVLNHRYRSANVSRGFRNNLSSVNRHQHNSAGSSMIEMDYALTVLDKGIGVTQNIYTNGYLAEQSNWMLLKR